ncbi:MAG: helix-turn-helix domain-containing protein [Acidobacteriia bacterium]|nr:helix-turn-helix domain-containing protein [Terriglobia bacterium]
MSPELSGKLIHVEEVVALLMGDAYLPKRSAAKYLGMSPRKLEGLREIERYRVGGMLYFRRSILDKFMERHAETREATPAPVGGLRGLLQAAKKRALAEEKNT